MSEFAPGGSKARMTKTQIKKYLANMEKAQKLAQSKLEEAKHSGELEKEALELAELEKKLDDFA